MSQLAFGFDRDASADERLLPSDGQLFLDPEHDLFVGAQRLERYLIDNDLGWVVRLAGMLKKLDYSALVDAYSVAGRRALHPRVILGLVVYGILNRQWSLRELEALARRDVGAWWICGGHQPDHSTIGKFAAASRYRSLRAETLFAVTAYLTGSPPTHASQAFF